MRLDVVAVALLTVVPMMAMAPGLADGANAQDPGRILGERVFALTMERSHFNGQTWPDTPLLEAYEGERMRFIVHVPITAEMHTFHLHGHPWKDVDTGRFVDAVRLDAGETLRFNQTAGLEEGHDGDWFYHCHVGGHFTNGMWGLLRVYPYEMQVDGELDGLTVTLNHDGEGLEGATFDARLRQGPDQVTGATVGDGQPVDLHVRELGDGRYRVVPDLASSGTGELVLTSNHDEGESVARLDVTQSGYELDRDLRPSSTDAGPAGSLVEGLGDALRT